MIVRRNPSIFFRRRSGWRTLLLHGHHPPVGMILFAKWRFLRFEFVSIGEDIKCHFQGAWAICRLVYQERGDAVIV